MDGIWTTFDGYDALEQKKLKRASNKTSIDHFSDEAFSKIVGRSGSEATSLNKFDPSVLFYPNQVGGGTDWPNL